MALFVDVVNITAKAGDGGRGGSVTSVIMVVSVVLIVRLSVLDTDSSTICTRGSWLSPGFFEDSRMRSKMMIVLLIE